MSSSKRTHDVPFADDPTDLVLVDRSLPARSDDTQFDPFNTGPQFPPSASGSRPIDPAIIVSMDRESDVGHDRVASVLRSLLAAGQSDMARVPSNVEPPSGWKTPPPLPGRSAPGTATMRSTWRTDRNK